MSIHSECLCEYCWVEHVFGRWTDNRQCNVGQHVEIVVCSHHRVLAAFRGVFIASCVRCFQSSNEEGLAFKSCLKVLRSFDDQEALSMSIQSECLEYCRVEHVFGRWTDGRQCQVGQCVEIGVLSPHQIVLA
mmetsp:Transcript_11839/g.30605  ORF Transcript_11839/g.30605 Transcript_11839/m.30605 type:complete len:132 (-) Transcript_11839:121-516(-)